jgi:hypothetical protein
MLVLPDSPRNLELERNRCSGGDPLASFRGQTSQALLKEAIDAGEFGLITDTHLDVQEGGLVEALPWIQNGYMTAEVIYRFDNLCEHNASIRSLPFPVQDLYE